MMFRYSNNGAILALMEERSKRGVIQYTSFPVSSRRSKQGRMLNNLIRNKTLLCLYLVGGLFL